jgi:ankyrin repeat protein
MVTTSQKSSVLFLMFVGIALAWATLNGMSIFDAASLGFIDRIEELINQKVDVNQSDVNGNTALILAAWNNKFEVVKKLLDAGADPIKTDKYGRTALELALDNGNAAESVKLLLNRTDKNSNTALILAADKGNSTIVNMLLNAGANANIANKNGGTALILTVLIDKDDKSGIAKKIFDKCIGTPKTEIPSKSAFLTFTQNEDNNAIACGLLNALSYKVVCIASAYMLNRLISQYAFLSGLFTSGKLSLFVNSPKDTLGIIIPDNTDDFSEYGFTNLTYIKSEAAVAKLNSLTNILNDSQIGGLIDDFKNIISATSPNHPTRFYLEGHGGVNIIANIPIDTFGDSFGKNIKQFFTVLADIDTQFLYIKTCNAGGQNLLKMQNEIQKIIEVSKTIEELSKKTTKNIDYAIAVQATSDVPTYGFGNLNAFFVNLDKYFRYFDKNLDEFKSQIKDDTSAPSIEKALGALGVMHEKALQSIRYPGTTTFFRPIKPDMTEDVKRKEVLQSIRFPKKFVRSVDSSKFDLNEMEIITWSKLRALRVEADMKFKRAKAKELHESSINAVSSQNQPQASSVETQIGEGPVKITIPIKPGIKYVQVFPCNLDDCIFEIKDSKMPAFISKMPGRAQHFIGKITFASNETDFTKALSDFIANGFTMLFEEKEDIKEKGTYTGLTPKCWFIKTLELTAGDKPYAIDSLVIKMDPNQKPRHAYHDINGYHSFDGTGAQDIVEEDFNKKIQEWFEASQASRGSLHEATGDHEKYLSKYYAITNSWKQHINIQNLIRLDLCYSIIQNDSDIAHELLNKYKHFDIDLEVHHMDGKTTLIVAARFGRTDIVRKLLDMGADPNKVDKNGKTALTLAKTFNHHDVAKILEDYIASHSESTSKK